MHHHAFSCAIKRHKGQIKTGWEVKDNKVVKESVPDINDKIDEVCHKKYNHYF